MGKAYAYIRLSSQAQAAGDGERRQRESAQQFAGRHGYEIVDYLQERGKRVHSARRVAASILSAMEGSFQLASAAAEHMPQAYAAKTMMALIDRFVELEPANEKKPK